MDSWGYKMISAVEVRHCFRVCIWCLFSFNYEVFLEIVQVVAEMAAIGFGLPKDAFTSLMKQVSFLGL